MRYVFFLLLALLAVHTGFAQGQEIDDNSVTPSLAASSHAPIVIPNAEFPARHGAEPDTTSPWRYFPLEIGNEWQYELYDPETGGIGYEGYRVRTDTLIEGKSYYALRYCRGSENCSTPETDTILRFDTTHSLVISRLVINNQPFLEWWEEVPCALDAPFNASQVTCTGLGGDPQYFTSGGHDYFLVLPPDTLQGITYKRFDSIGVLMGVVADLGVIFRAYQKQPRPIETLVYARIGGEEYGTPGFAFPTAAEQGPASLRPRLSVSPNPASDRVVLSFELSESEHLRLELYDMLGRRARILADRLFAAGHHSIHFDGTDLASGAYVLRAVMESEVSGEIRVVTRLLTLLN